MDMEKNGEYLVFDGLKIKSIDWYTDGNHDCSLDVTDGEHSYNHGEENLPDENENDDTERLWSALSYIPFASVFVIMTQKESKFVLYQ